MESSTDTQLLHKTNTTTDTGVEELTLVPKESVADKIVTKDQFDEIGIKSYTGKRLFDLFIGSFALLGFLFLYPLIALGIKLTSKGPVLFKQKRTGIRGEVFYCYKFRTMHLVQKKPKNGQPVVTEQGDRRIFSFGQFLRKTNLDELPQILNVMKGDMSLVGPRPYPVDECIYWNQIFDDHYYRYMTYPGITGYAQAKGYRGGTLQESIMRKRLDYDLIYVEKSEFLFDLSIIYATAYRMFKNKTNGH